MDIELLEDFVTLAETMNFSSAAGRRNLTQPAFSRRIRALEAWVGAPLLRRTSRSVSLTSAGQLFLPQAAAVVRDLKRARDDVREHVGKSDRGIAIAATHALSFTFVPRWILQRVGYARFGSINLISDSYEECEALLLRGEVVFLISHRRAGARTRLAEPRFTAHVVGNDVLAPLTLPGADGAPIHRLGFASGTPPAPHLAYAPPSGLGPILEGYWAEDGRRPNLRTAFRSQLAATLLEMAREGQGVAWVPLSPAERELNDGGLTRAGGPEFDVPVEVTITRPATPLGAHAERFWQRATAAR